jgi:hypothetical protein
MFPADQAAVVLTAATDLNTAVRASLDTITVAEARRVIEVLREARGWMDGIAKLLETS